MRISDWSSDVCSSDLELIRTERSAIYGRIGTCTQSFGTLASWMIDVLAILTGNLDREGGSMWSRPVAPLVDMLATLPEGLPVVMGKSRVRGVPAVLGQFPASCQIGRAHVCTPVTNAQLVCRLLLEQKQH